MTEQAPKRTEWRLNVQTGQEMEFEETPRQKDYPHDTTAWTGRTRAPEGGAGLDPEVERKTGTEAGRRGLAEAMAAPLVRRASP